jgi:hypothetical protein
MPKLIYVRAASPTRICAWERHPAHPGGEVTVTGTEPVQVAETSFMMGRLASGDILRADPPAGEEPPAEKSAQEEPLVEGPTEEKPPEKKATARRSRRSK